MKFGVEPNLTLTNKFVHKKIRSVTLPPNKNVQKVDLQTFAPLPKKNTIWQTNLNISACWGVVCSPYPVNSTVLTKICSHKSPIIKDHHWISRLALSLLCTQELRFCWNWEKKETNLAGGCFFFFGGGAKNLKNVKQFLFLVWWNRNWIFKID